MDPGVLAVTGVEVMPIIGVQQVVQVVVLMAALAGSIVHCLLQQMVSNHVH